MMKQNNFNFLKLYAAIGVLIGHVATHMRIPAFGYEGGAIKPFYHLGVPFFFILSGFFLYPSYVKMRGRGESIRKFLIKRWVRIAPPIYFFVPVTLVIFLVIGAINFETLTEVKLWAWVTSNIFLFPVYHPDVFSHIGIGVVNGSLWTIVAQVSFYLGIPLIYWVETKIGFRKMIVLLMTVGVIGYIIFWGDQFLETQTLLVKVYEVTCLPHLIFFGLGILWSRIWNDIPKTTSMFVICVLIVFLVKQDVFGIYPYIGELTLLLWAVPFSYSIIWFGFHGPKLFHKFNRIDDLGMGIYIWHMIFVNTFLYLGFREVAWLSNPLMHLLVIAVTIPMAYVSRILIEKPALKLYSPSIKARKLEPRSNPT